MLAPLGTALDKVGAPLEQPSGGMQQQVAIARALLTSPVLLLLDEPTTGLDPRSKRDVQAFILEVRRQHEATVLLTTHDMEEAERLCDRPAIMDQGHIPSCRGYSTNYGLWSTTFLGTATWVKTI